MTIAQKQLYIYLTLIGLTIVAALYGYRLTQQKWLLYRNAESRFYEKNFQEAILLYQQSLKEGFTTVNLFVHLADAYTTVGNFPEAIAYYRKYLNLNPKDKHVRLLLARTLSWNGNLKESKEEYQKVLEKTHEN